MRKDDDNDDGFANDFFEESLDDEQSDKDYTVCSAEDCGYCGHCDY